MQRDLVSSDMPGSLRVRVPAKINLSLAVGPPRPDGFHNLATVFQALSLYDTVTLRDRGDGAGVRLTISGSQANQVPVDEKNLAWQAAELAAEQTGKKPDLDIDIEKGIPVAGGMAGGSADAAAVLVGCSALWDIDEDLVPLAAQLGSDVPFALVGGTAVGQGRGEQVASAMTRGKFHWVLALSDGELATPKVYAEIDRLRGDQPVLEPVIAEDVVRAVRTGDATALGAALTNDLQPAALSLMPALSALLELGPEHGALGSIISGSGPTCAFLVSDEEAALELTVALSASGLCRTVRQASAPVPGATVVSRTTPM